MDAANGRSGVGGKFVPHRGSSGVASQRIDHRRIDRRGIDHFRGIEWNRRMLLPDGGGGGGGGRGGAEYDNGADSSIASLPFHTIAAAAAAVTVTIPAAITAAIAIRMGKKGGGRD